MYRVLIVEDEDIIRKGIAYTASLQVKLPTARKVLRKFWSCDLIS